MSEQRTRQARRILPKGFYYFLALVLFGYRFFALPWITAPGYRNNPWLQVLWTLIVAFVIVRIVWWTHDEPIDRAEDELAHDNETARRRERMDHVMHGPLRPIVASAFTTKPGEICYWVEPDVVSEDGFSGSLYVTNERVVFMTPRQTRSFALDSIVAIDRYAEGLRLHFDRSPSIGFNCGDSAIAVVLERVKRGYLDDVPDGALP